MVKAGVQSYFAINQAQDTIAAKQQGNVIKTPFMSYGSFATYIHPKQMYGVIFGGSPKGMMMDIDQIMYQAVSKDNNTNELKSFIQSQGVRESANEHLVPEQLFNDPNATEKSVEGVSAVKALQLAAQQGQTIYTITQDNYNQVLPKLSLSSGVMSDIQNAINAGKQVTVHERNISYKNWTGSGYVILDPITGTGAYLIDGGANGGFAFGLGLATSSIIAAGIAGIFGIGGASLGLATLAPFLLGILGPLLVFFAIIVAVTLYSHRNDQDFVSCFIGGFAMNAVAFIGILFPNLGYVAGFGAGASIVGTAGGCYGY